MNKALAVVVSVCLALSALTIWMYGNARYSQGHAVCSSTVLKDAINAGKEYEKKEQEVMRLDDDGLVRRYCRWVYDIPYDQCVQTVKPIP